MPVKTGFWYALNREVSRLRPQFKADLSRHFIFNTINTVISLCVIDPNKAAQLTTALAECLNYTSKTAKEVALDEEWIALEAFLFIQQVRFSPRLTYQLPFLTHQGRIPKYALFTCMEDILEEFLSKSWHPVALALTLTQDRNTLQVEIKINEKRVLQHPIPFHKI